MALFAEHITPRGSGLIELYGKQGTFCIKFHRSLLLIIPTVRIQIVSSDKRVHSTTCSDQDQTEAITGRAMSTRSINDFDRW
jgi:hypothetical protein